jgi:ubiquinone/menaquinone biosynthesis C-methylase UbiE
MFLGRRSLQAEYFDSARPLNELAQFFQCLTRLNRLFAFAEPFQRLLPRLMGNAHSAALSLLDVGAGDGTLGKALTAWAATRGWKWNITNLDCNLEALTLNRDARCVAGSGLALPFVSGSFDMVIASQMLHHLTDAQALIVLRESWRVARRGILVCDLHRNSILYSLLWALFQFQQYPRSFRGDALLSVKRSWRVSELRKLLDRTELRQAEVRLYFGARIVLQARKPPSVAAN